MKLLKQVSIDVTMKIARGIWAVLPVKQIDEAKTRLAPECSTEFRRGLARAMAEDVLDTLANVPELAGIALVTVDSLTIERAAKYGARVRIFTDAALDGHTASVMAAARRLAYEGSSGMLTVPGDIPNVTTNEVSQLLAAHGEAPAFSIVPAHDRRGTNAVVMSPPDVVSLAFGNDSFIPHLEAARRHGIEPVVVPLPGVGLDIDNYQDLVQLMQRPSATRTWAFLSACLPTAPADMIEGAVRKTLRPSA